LPTAETRQRVFFVGQRPRNADHLEGPAVGGCEDVDGVAEGVDVGQPPPGRDSRQRRRHRAGPRRQPAGQRRHDPTQVRGRDLADSATSDRTFNIDVVNGREIVTMRP
jgi:hypothetical protein